MAGLPTLSAPELEIKLYSVDKPVKYRPFLVKEEKILLIALESDEPDQMLKAIKQILKNCCLSSNVKVDSLPLFDIEYWFLNIRGSSVGDILNLNLKCNKCEERSPVDVNLRDVEIQHHEGHTNLIQLTDTITVEMSYPTLNTMWSVEKKQTTESMFDMISTNVKQIIDGDTIYDTKLYSKNDLTTFLESLSPTQFGKLTEFFGTMPYLAHTIEFDCKGCGQKNLTVVEGLQNFFT